MATEEKGVKIEITTRYDVVKGRRIKKYETERRFVAGGEVVEQLDRSYVTGRGRKLKKPGIWKRLYRYPKKLMIIESYNHPFKKVHHAYVEYRDAEGRADHCEEWMNKEPAGMVLIGYSFWRYDDQGRLAEKVDAMVQNNFKPVFNSHARVRYFYDDRGRLCRNTYGSVDERNEDNVIVYEYDDKGRKIEERDMLRGKMFRIIRYAYAEDGGLIETRESSRVRPDLEPQLYRVTGFRYEIGPNSKTTYKDITCYDEKGKAQAYRTVETTEIIRGEGGR